MLKKAKTHALGALLLLIMMLSLGCGGQGLIPDLPPIQPPVQASKGSIEGYVYAPIGSEPVAARVSESAAPPVGHKAVANAAVSAVCGSETKSANTTASGYFAIAQLPVGSCTVTITKEGYGSYSTTVTVQANTITAIGGDAGMSLTPAASGALIVKTNVPGATIYIDGQNTNITMTDTERRIDNLSPGAHDVSLSNLNGFLPLETQIAQINNNGTKTIDFLFIPSNEYIYFGSERDTDFSGDSMTWETKTKIYRMKPDGTEQERLTSLDPAIQDFISSVSPDGSTLLLMTDDPEFTNGEDYSLILMNSDGTNRRAIAPDHLPAVNPRFSYDSNYIIYASFDGDFSKCNISLPCPDIFIMDRFGNTMNQVTNNGYLNNEPSISPDGKTVVFYSTRPMDVGRSTNIYRVDVDGTNERQLTFGGVGQSSSSPSFTPDGKKIIYESSISGTKDIWVMDIDGNNAMNLTNDTYYDTHARLSPGGTKIVFESNRYDVGGPDDRINLEICIMDLDGSNITRLTDAPGVDSKPVWTP